MTATLTPELDRLSRRLQGQVSTRMSTRLAHAHDASHFLFTPSAVVTAKGIDDVAAILRARPGAVTFRSGGTSLSGQAGTEGIMVDTRRGFRGIEVLEDGARVRVQPGATVGSVNAVLARHGRKLGPDPASESACTIGGVVADNSSGMVCGTERNTYRTLRSAVLVLPSGTVLDTARPDADAVLAAAEPEIHAGLARLRDRVRGNPDSVAGIRRLFAMKNTMGYGVNSFLDFDSPAQILAHLVIGSEGTLAFVAEATFATVPVVDRIATGLLIFSDLHEATAALPDLVATGFAAIELLDATSLRVAQRDPGADDILRGLHISSQAALLVELQEADDAALGARMDAAAALLASLPLEAGGDLSRDPAERTGLWSIRKGLYASVAGNRPPGTTALLEDIAVPVERLGATCAALMEMFPRYGYADAVIFGHAKDGNIHFMVTPSLSDPHALEQFGAFTEEMVDLVLAAGGTLKAEHGTGRVMAPFVRRQYGAELYAVMREVKALVDPAGILNPGVVLTDDDEAHMHSLKSAPTVESEVDRCVECGYCEPVCHSRDLTLTPRQRIVLRRELARARADGRTDLAEEIRADYSYDGVQTCAVDGMCETACPVNINTGDLVRRLRAQEQEGTPAAQVWRGAASVWDPFTAVAGVALEVAGAVPPALPAGVTGAARGVLGAEAVPSWSADLPRGGRRRRSLRADRADLVFFPSCLETMFAPAGPAGADSAGTAFLRLLRAAGLRPRVPEGIASLCCGTPWSSKGMREGKEAMASRVAATLWEASEGGRLPVVCDAASCTEGLIKAADAAEEAGLQVMDSVTYAARELLQRLSPLTPAHRTLVVHPTCSSTAIGATEDLLTVARASAQEVIVPDGWGCCGFAGDRGMLHPELTASATAAEAASLAGIEADGYVSANRTCEIGMTRATGHTYQHVLQVLAQAAGV